MAKKFTPSPKAPMAIPKNNPSHSAPQTNGSVPKMRNPPPPPPPAPAKKD